jgi:hypothetical protein
MKRKTCDPCHEKKSNEKCTVLSSNEWRVRRYYNTDLRRLKNWFLDKWKSNRLIKASNSTIQWLMNAIVDVMKISSQEIYRPSVVPRSIYANQRIQVWWFHPTRQNIKNKHDTFIIARLLASVSRQINRHLSTYGERSNMSAHIVIG